MMIEYCRERGTKRLIAQTLTTNHEMQSLARKFNFTQTRNEDDEQSVSLSLELG
jgi:hypothetical protein